MFLAVPHYDHGEGGVGVGEVVVVFEGGADGVCDAFMEGGDLEACQMGLIWQNGNLRWVCCPR